MGGKERVGLGQRLRARRQAMGLRATPSVEWSMRPPSNPTVSLGQITVQSHQWALRTRIERLSKGKTQLSKEIDNMSSEGHRWTQLIDTGVGTK